MKGFKSSIVLIFLNLLIVQAHSKPTGRIVSLAPMITKMIYLLEANDQLVGCTSYCDIAIKDKKSIVSSVMEVNVEKIYLLKPDLVLTTSLTKPPVIESIEKLGIKVKVFNLPNSYDELCSLFIEIGKLTGKSMTCASILQKQQVRLTSIKHSIPANRKPKVFFEIGAKPLFTVTPNTFMDNYIGYSGGVNIAADLKNGLISKELILVRNPDIILIVTMGILTKDEKTMWEQYTNLNASRNKKIFFVDADESCSPDPVTFVNIVEQLVTQMYK